MPILTQSRSGRRSRLTLVVQILLEPQQRSSSIGKHIATGYLTDAPARDIRAVAHGVMAAARKAVGTLYMTKRGSDGARVEMIRTIWSFTYLCPSCGDEMVFYEALNARASPIGKVSRWPLSTSRRPGPAH